MLGKVEVFLAVEKDDPKRDDVVTDLRDDINTWVAKYRRRGNFTGRPSFGCGLSVLNTANIFTCALYRLLSDPKPA